MVCWSTFTCSAVSILASGSDGNATDNTFAAFSPRAKARRFRISICMLPLMMFLVFSSALLHGYPARAQFGRSLLKLLRSKKVLAGFSSICARTVYA